MCISCLFNAREWDAFFSIISFDVLDRLKEEDPDMDYQYMRECYVPQYNLDTEHKLIQSARKSFEIMTGRKNNFLVRHGGSDAHKIVEKYPYACIPNYGPGDEIHGGVFTANERCSIQEYLDFIKIYMKMVVDMQG